MPSVLGKRKATTSLSRRPMKRATTRKAVANMVKSMVQNAAETKLFVPALVGTTINNTALIDELSDIAQDDGEGGRVGNKVTARFVKILGDISLNSNALAVATVARISVIQWFPSSTPTAALLFEAAARPDLALWNKDQAEHFRVLYDRRFVLTNSGNNRAISFKIKAYPHKRNRVISYDGDAVTTGGSHLYLVASASDNTYAAGLEYQSGLYYTDV